MKKVLFIVLSIILFLVVTFCSDIRCVFLSKDKLEKCLVFPETNLSYPIRMDTSSKLILHISNVGSLDFDEQLYNLVKKAYWDGIWDGTPTELGLSPENVYVTISISRSGRILFNGHKVGNHDEHVDLPDPFTDSVDSLSEYIYGHGVYVIKNNTLVKYFHGKMISLGEPIGDLKGYDMQSIYEYYLNQDEEKQIRFYGDAPRLYYVDNSNTLLLVTTNPLLKERYLYVFPDYDRSEIKYIGQISDYTIFGSSTGDNFYYLDKKGRTWIYTENGPEIVEGNSLF